MLVGGSGMSIIRGPRPETKFYVVDKTISEDGRLSWAARGMLIYLLGKPDNWVVSTHHLINQTKDALGKVSGRDAVRVVLKELEAAGYLTVNRARGEDGLFSGMDYIVSEQPLIVEPQTENPVMATPQTENPSTDNPAADNPPPDNPPLIKNDLKQLPEKAVKPELNDCETPPAAPPPLATIPLLPLPVMADGPKDPACKTFQVWHSYSAAYLKRYDTRPVWNQRVASQLAMLVKRLGIEVAHHVAAYYVTINDAGLIRDNHSVNRLLAGAEAYHTQWKTNRQVNGTMARQLEQKQANISAGQAAAAQILARAGGQQNEFL